MSHKHLSKMRISAQHRAQNGSMLAIAIFIITAMALLVVSMTNVLSNASTAIAYEVSGTRALAAANSGAQIVLRKVVPFQPNVPAFAGCPATLADPAEYTVSSLPNFHNCDVSVNCQQFYIAATGYTHYRVESTATCSSTDFQTVRTVAIEAREK
jgi:MSHA biogenesis protein MshP